MKYFLSAVVLLLLASNPASANFLPDSDKDGVPDRDEKDIYHTNLLNSDTDDDGYGDWQELNSGHSPLSGENLKLEQSDFDGDGLSDRMEFNFHTDLANKDSDQDGYIDGEEIAGGYDPLNREKVKLNKRIEINISKQKLRYFLGAVKMDEFSVSSGMNNSTPKGLFLVTNKSLKAWSSYGLWMPYWLGLAAGRFGIHELPVWPNGYREGEDHLGRPVSHGCIRLGVGPAKFIYNWADIGTPVYIY